MLVFHLNIDKLRPNNLIEFSPSGFLFYPYTFHVGIKFELLFYFVTGFQAFWLHREKGYMFCIM